MRGSAVGSFKDKTIRFLRRNQFTDNLTVICNLKVSAVTAVNVIPLIGSYTVMEMTA